MRFEPQESKQQGIDDTCNHTHMTEKERSTDIHAANAEDAWTQSISEVTYDLNAASYRMGLETPVRDTADIDIRSQQWVIVEGSEHQIKFKDEAHTPCAAAMDGTSGEGCPLAPVYIGSGNISWGSLAASKAQ